MLILFNLNLNQKNYFLKNIKIYYNDLGKVKVVFI